MSDDRDDALAGLVVDVAELQRQVDELSGLRGSVKDVARSVSELRAALEELAADTPPAPPRIWSWPALNASEAEAAWNAIRSWLLDIALDRYPVLRRELLACWYLHADVLDGLTALYTTWRSAYEDPKAPADAAAVWLDRWLPAAIKQLREGLRSCSRDSHQANAMSAADIDRLLGADYDAFVEAEVAARPLPTTT